MSSIAEIRQKYPQYQDLSDTQLADALHSKFYSDMPTDQFYAKIGLVPQPPPAAMAGNGGTSDPNDPQFQGLALPGQKQPPGAPPVNTVPGNEHFGFSSSDTLNPLPALSVMGNELAGSVPMAGPTLRNMGENFDSAVSGVPREQVATSNEAAVQKNPEAATIGRVAGIGLPLLGLGATEAGAQLLGLTGPLWQRMLMGGASTFGIQAGDEVARGKSLQQALGDALLPGAAGAALPLGGALAKKLLAPVGELSPERQAAVSTLKQEGVPLTAGQAAGSKWLKYREGELGGNAAQDFMENQAQQFTKAALSKAGVTANGATPDVLNKAFGDIGNEFDSLAARNTMQMDSQLSTDLGSAVRDYNSVTNPAARAPVIVSTLQDIVDAAKSNGNALSGEAYKSLVSRLGRAQRTSKDPELIGALRDIRTSLDAAMERSIAKTNPADLGAWQDVRGRYKNLMVIENAANGAGEQAALGNISPAKLRQAIAAQDKKGMTRGRSDLEPLARSGNATMAPLPDSGTASRIAARLAPMGLSALSGGLAGSSIGGVGGAAIGSLGGAALSTGLGRLLLSGPGRSYLSGRAAPAITESALAKLLPRALMLNAAQGVGQ